MPVTISVVSCVIAISIPVDHALRGARSMVMVTTRTVAHVQMIVRNFAVVTLPAHFRYPVLSFTFHPARQLYDGDHEIHVQPE